MVNRFDFNDAPEENQEGQIPQQQTQEDRITIKWGGSGLYQSGSDSFAQLMDGIELPYTVGKVRRALVEKEAANVEVPASIYDSQGNEMSNAPDDFILRGTCTLVFRMPHGSLGLVS